MIACNRCSLPCHRDRVECEKWFHYGCTDIPAYFIIHLEELKNIHYICEICVLTDYEVCHGCIAKIEGLERRGHWGEVKRSRGKSGGGGGEGGV